MTPLLQAEAATKEFAEFKLGPIDFTLNPGECCSIFGMNGAGKSTFFSLLTGSQDATSGNIRIEGERFLPDHFQVKRRIGYLPQDFELPLWLTPRNILNYAATLYEFADAKELVNATLERWDCLSYASLPLAQCSHGMKKRAALGLATIHNPDILVLDEPFSGLDIYHISALENLLKSRVAAKKATILSTHISLYAARLSPSAYIMNKGELSSVDGWQEAEVLERINIVERFFAAPEIH